MVNSADRLPAVGGLGIAATFQFIQFFQYGHWNRYMVFFEIEQGGGVVNQDVGVEDIEGRLVSRFIGQGQGITHKHFSRSLLF